ncbi:CHRNB3 [Branchiostoma lanceolatum]|uniref:CHRNB3 protein n=1 Tax=Branchiostoma lanceolatum TaxID=7740 RepID=A0A8K0A5L8_BRALA|nr:CHRNB3 [Branchiostoma lanceolatum]
MNWWPSSTSVLLVLVSFACGQRDTGQQSGSPEPPTVSAVADRIPRTEISLQAGGGAFNSPGFPDDYPNNTNIRWQIEASIDYCIRLTFDQFDVEKSEINPNCPWDYVAVYDRDVTTNGDVLIGKFCGTTPPGPITSATKTLSVEFVSDSTVRQTGFSATFHAVTSCVGGPDPPRSPRCSDVPDEFYNYCKDLGYQKTIGPNMFGQTVNEVLGSQQWSEMKEANPSCHPHLRPFLCPLLMPRCHITINSTRGARIQKQLPCRSWCEEVKSSCPSVFANGSSFESMNCNLLTSSDCVNLEPHEDCYYGRGQNYKGMTTLPEESGSTCLKWTSFLSVGLIAKFNWADPRENYCRNFALGNTEEPFCLVKTVANAEELIAMEPCGLKPCNAIGCGVPPDVTFGSRSPVKNFYLPGEKVFITCNRGYLLETDEDIRITCTQNGTWSKTDIRCSADYSLQLSHVLLDAERYSSRLPPSTGHVNVTFEAAVVEIIDADEKNEHMFGSMAFRLRWRDSRLFWTPAKYGGVTQLVMTTENVWIPNIYLMRNGDAKFSKFPSAPVIVTSDGEVEWDIIDLLTTTCDLDPRLFPFDSMTCPVCLGATTSVERFNCPDPQDDRYPPEAMTYIEHFMKCGDQTEEVVDQWNAKWKVTVEGGVFGQGCISVTFDRIPTYHSCTTLSPVIILSILMCITFTLPIDKYLIGRSCVLWCHDLAVHGGVSGLHHGGSAG